MHESDTREYEHFLQELRDARLRAGMSQAQLASRLGLDQSLVSKCETGVRRVDVVELRRWVMALGGTLSQFVAAYEARLSRHRLPPPSIAKPRRVRRQ
jgi:transcriptional regulator with XRE-family HTH domain